MRCFGKRGTKIEGQAGEPRAKHIHTAEKGLFGKPTNLNNVETWANVPVIIQQGADWGLWKQGAPRRGESVR